LGCDCGVVFSSPDVFLEDGIPSNGVGFSSQVLAEVGAICRVAGQIVAAVSVSEKSVD